MGKQSLKPEDVKEVLRRVDEFNALDTGDTIANTIGSYQICHIRFTLRQLDLISFMRNDELVSIDRDEYLLNNWVKVPKEIAKE